jgi:transcriptional regulator with XRE-family HTH domain
MVRTTRKGLMMAKPAADEEDSPEVKEFYAAVGHRVRSLRELAGLSQKELSNLCSIRQPYIFEIEKFGVNLSLKSIFKLAFAFGVPPRDLLPGALDDKDYETKYRVLREKVMELRAALEPVETRYAELVAVVDTRRDRDKRRPRRDS